jgi:N-acetyl-anhydromuramyl-L-alanine amidase AmpD
MLPIQWLTIHCAATPEGRNVSAEQVELWDRARFNQPSYHWVVELDGKIHRSLDDGVRGAHVGGHNTGNIGVCYVGGCDVHMKAKDTRTAAQRASLAALVRDYRAKYPGIKILGHRDWPNVHKDCPSFSVSDWLAEIGAAA